MTDQLDRLVELMARLRRECPWDARQTHLSLVHSLVEETCEVVEAIEAGDDADLREELGDLLLQVVFHSAIAEEQNRFDISEVARGICDKLTERHPWVFAGDAVPDDLNATWEAGKKAAKGRNSCLDGIPVRLSGLARAQKVLSRATSHGVAVPDLGATTPAVSTTRATADADAGSDSSEAPAPDTTAPVTAAPDSAGSVTAEQIGREALSLAARAQAHGIDAEQALRAALRGLEGEIREIETGAT